MPISQHEPTAVNTGPEYAALISQCGRQIPLQQEPLSVHAPNSRRVRDLEDVITRFCHRHLELEIMGELQNQGGCGKVYLMQAPDLSIMIVKAGVLGDPELILEEGKIQYEISQKTSSVPKVFYLGSITVSESNTVSYKPGSSNNLEAEVLIPAGTKIPITVMESVNGGDLFSWLANEIHNEKTADRKGRSLYERLEMFKRIVNAVGSIHDAGYAHQDVKPENILIPADEIPMIIDFGIAGKIGQERKNNKVNCTPYYASPEHLLCKNDARMDIYSLGCILYEMLTGKTPLSDAVERIFRSTPRSGGNNLPFRLLEAMTQETKLTVEMTEVDEQKFERVPDEINEIHHRCRRFNADERYQSCQELSEAVDNVISDMRLYRSVLELMKQNGVSGFGTNVNATTINDPDPAEQAFFALVVETLRLADARILPHKRTALDMILAKDKYSGTAPKNMQSQQPVIAHKIVSVGNDGQPEVHNYATITLDDADTKIVINVDEIIADGDRISAPNNAREESAPSKQVPPAPLSLDLDF
ncbi:protein kinase [Candidatus Woesearchaeota archaeon]|nr:protein kinase [Candidatus Woesearchaeota archaeon]